MRVCVFLLFLKQQIIIITSSKVVSVRCDKCNSAGDPMSPAELERTGDAERNPVFFTLTAACNIDLSSTQTFRPSGGSSLLYCAMENSMIRPTLCSSKLAWRIKLLHQGEEEARASGFAGGEDGHLINEPVSS